MDCKQTSSFKDLNGYSHYYACQFKVYCIATYKSSSTGEYVTHRYCKKHYNALVKNCTRVQKLTGFDSDLKIELV